MLWNARQGVKHGQTTPRNIQFGVLFRTFCPLEVFLEMRCFRNVSFEIVARFCTMQDEYFYVILHLRRIHQIQLPVINIPETDMEPEIILCEKKNMFRTLVVLGSILAFRCVLLAEHRAKMI